jgi:hypothetical protein
MTTGVSPDMINMRADEIAERLTRGEKKGGVNLGGGAHQAATSGVAARGRGVDQRTLGGPDLRQRAGRQLARLEHGEEPLSGLRCRTTASGQPAGEVLPHGVFDRLLLNGFRAEVWLRLGITEAQARATAGLGARTPDQTVARPLLEIGSALAYHPQTSAVHMTGSEQTHDAIVWGPGQEGRDARAAGSPKLTKPITSELGGVAPVIVVPGKWSPARSALPGPSCRHATAANAGSNCIAAEIVIVSRDWDEKDAFLAKLRRALAAAPGRPGWYPGSEDRVGDARERHPSTAEIVKGAPGRTLLTGLDVDDPAETAFSTEYFAPVLGSAELPGTASSSWRPRSRRRTTACTARSARTSSSIPTPGESSASPSSAASPPRYGTIAINAWTGVGYLAPCATWGAFPRTHPRRCPERDRPRPQRASARGYRADGRHGSVPTGTQVAVARRMEDLAEAAVVRRQQDSGDNRATARLVRDAAPVECAPVHLRVRVARMTGNHRDPVTTSHLASGHPQFVMKTRTTAPT